MLDSSKEPLLYGKAKYITLKLNHNLQLYISAEGGKGYQDRG
jgi:hypothetical protein